MGPLSTDPRRFLIHCCSNTCHWVFTVLSTWDASIDKIDKDYFFHGTYIQVVDTSNKQYLRQINTLCSMSEDDKCGGKKKIVAG